MVSAPQALVALLPLVILAGWAPPAPARSTGSPDSGHFEFCEVRVRDAVRRFAVWLPPGHERTRSWPAIVFLHGSGECGDDGARQTRIGLGPVLEAHPGQWPFVVVMPQKSSDMEEWEENEDLVFAALASATGAFGIDSSRVALVGLSQGGHGTWLIGARHPGHWTCLVPVCAYGHALTVSRRVAPLPVWAFHGLIDDIVNPEDTRKIVAGIREARARLGLAESEVRATYFPQANHNSWDSAFAEPELPGWILKHSRGE